MRVNLLFIFLGLVFFSVPVKGQDIENDLRNNQQLSKRAIEFAPEQFPFQHLEQWITDKQIVMLGDATHGSREFYQYRAQITQYLIEKHGFSAVIVEGNWPAGQQVNQYINNTVAQSAKQALIGFNKYFPWVWRNQTLVEFVQWMKLYNRGNRHQPVSFYGMDLFSLTTSITRNIELLNKHTTPLNAQFLTMYQCFSAFKNNSLEYGKHAVETPSLSCQTQAQQQLNIISKQANLINNKADYFDLLMNSKMIQAAEQYFRMTFEAQDAEIWNIREQVMLETINDIIKQHKINNKNAKVIIWAHNSHTGDARATGMKDVGQVSLGQLLRQQFGKQQVFLMGALSYQGEVIASKNWGESGILMKMPGAVEGSYSHLFHQLGLSRFIMDLSSLSFSTFYQRFIGVVYVEEEEHLNHYNTTQINRQFDAILFVDKTNAVRLLD